MEIDRVISESSPIQCGFCGYHLVGGHNLRCPECGKDTRFAASILPWEKRFKHGIIRRFLATLWLTGVHFRRYLSSFSRRHEVPIRSPAVLVLLASGANFCFYIFWNHIVMSGVFLVIIHGKPLHIYVRAAYKLLAGCMRPIQFISDAAPTLTFMFTTIMSGILLWCICKTACGTRLQISSLVAILSVPYLWLSIIATILDGIRGTCIPDNTLAYEICALLPYLFFAGVAAIAVLLANVALGISGTRLITVAVLEYVIAYVAFRLVLAGSTLLTVAVLRYQGYPEIGPGI